MTKNLDRFGPLLLAVVRHRWVRMTQSAVAIFAIQYLLVVSCCSSSRAQDDDPADADVDIGVRFNAGAVPPMNRAQLEEYMYNSLGGSKAAFHKSKRETIRRELDRVNSICSLSESQWSKLNEAIEVDIQHIDTKMTSLMSTYDGKLTPQLLQDMQTKIWQFTSSLQMDKPDSKSVWHKVLLSQLTKDQLEKLKADEEKKLENQMRTNRLRVLLSLQRKLGLNAVQRTKIDEWLSQSNFHELEFQLICAELAKSETAKEVLRADQVRVLAENSPAAKKLQLQMNPILPRNEILR